LQGKFGCQCPIFNIWKFPTPPVTPTLVGKSSILKVELQEREDIPAKAGVIGWRGKVSGMRNGGFPA